MGMTEEKGKQSNKTGLVLDDGRIESIKEFVSPEQLYQDLIERVRKSGEPYIIHPLCVAIILADLELDKETIVAGLLHDVVEDTVMTTDEISSQFGPDVALLVDGVTKLQHLHLADNSGN